MEHGGSPEFFVATGKPHKCLERYRGAIEEENAHNQTKIHNHNILNLLLIPMSL